MSPLRHQWRVTLKIGTLSDYALGTSRESVAGSSDSVGRVTRPEGCSHSAVLQPWPRGTADANITRPDDLAVPDSASVRLCWLTYLLTGDTVNPGL
jgi:hypothetical protein